MNVYVESNFVLELALVQEQHESCEAILRLGETGQLRLVIPAYSLVEPYETLVRRHRQRKRMKSELDDELRQLARTLPYARRLENFQNLTALLIESAKEEAERLEDVRVRLFKTAHVIALELPVLEAAARYQRAHDLSPQDAAVYAAVRFQLEREKAPRSCFLNKNSKDFDDPDLVEELDAQGCKLLPRFDAGYRFILGHIA